MERKMTRRIVFVLCALLALGLLPMQSKAGDAGSTVRVALLDMSAVVGGGRGYTQGLPYGAGPAGQYGGGMMGYANPGSGIMGYGMMGYGMMGQGMMAIRADRTSAKAGRVAFDVTNWSRSVIHEMVIVAVDGPDAPLPYDYNKLQVPEEQVKMVGDSGALAPNASKTVEVELALGSYILLCNVPGHYAAGMAIAFTVTQ
jgi:uncharacterized cupredoxin-like copper-binding protein